MTVGGDEPILASWKISDVLKRHPEVLDVLVAANPAFARLRNPVLRRVQSRLVTVGQAAAIAGLGQADLVRRLNVAAGLAAPDAAAGDPAGGGPPGAPADPAALDSAPVAAELDVRPYHERGEEPFSAIVAAARRVPPGQALLLRNTFEPLPLYDALGRLGFVAASRRLGPDDWETRFLNTGRPPRAPAPPPAAPPPTAAGWAAPDATVTIDVSELVPPEPLVKILEALEALPPGATLLVHHVRRPLHLYPRLDALGCRHETREPAPGRVEVLIHKPAAG
ncbi:MAG TPA: DUF2249 domain-containing protein, partial [Thermomicrobiales bacterium]|nr:DUF2249 domain-containing protein [Thermomicrobiales bacterium]